MKSPVSFSAARDLPDNILFIDVGTSPVTSHLFKSIWERLFQQISVYETVHFIIAVSVL